MTIRIMVVDDEPVIGKLLIYQLAGFGYQVSYFQDGLEALQQLPTTRPDLVLLDVMMPLISGWEVCRQIRACSSVPIIMLTAKGAETDIVTGLGAGADDYVTKPFGMAALHARIEAVLRRSTSKQSAYAPIRPPAQADPHLTLESEGSRRQASIHTVIPTLSEGQAQALAKIASADPTLDSPDAPPVRLGQHIRKIRATRGLTLHQVERSLKIRWEFLQAIEQENWGYVPRAEINRVLRAYTTYLDIDMPALLGHSHGGRPYPLMPLHFAAALALVMVLVVVGMYFL
jgi:DNA-binding response OmpR family regulator